LFVRSRVASRRRRRDASRRAAAVARRVAKSHRARRRRHRPRAVDDPRALRDATDRSVAMGSASRAPIATTESRRDDAPTATRVRSMDRWMDGWMNGWIAKCARNALESAR
jgi:hypothetical protein